jgi:hypothetical protein
MSGNFSNFLGRDNILVNLDSEGYGAYLKGRQERLKNKDRIEQINNMDREITDLKSQVSKLENLLLQVLEKNK